MTGQARSKEKYHDSVDVYMLFTQPAYIIMMLEFHETTCNCQFSTTI